MDNVIHLKRKTKRKKKPEPEVYTKTDSQWLDTQIIRTARLEHGGDVNPALLALAAECRKRKYPQTLGDLRKWVMSIRNGPVSELHKRIIAHRTQQRSCGYASGKAVI